MDQSRPARRGGFTLIELMIAVIIIGVLAVVAIRGFAIIRNRAKKAEVGGMLAEFRIKEEAWRSTQGVYLSTTSDETEVYPAIVAGAPPQTVTNPPKWTQLQIRAQKKELYCGYVVVAGNAGVAPSGAAGIALLGSTAPTEPWFYARACCDLDGDYSGDGTCPASCSTLSTFEITSTQSSIGESCDGE